MRIWEKDIQSLTSLINDYMQKYIYYEIQDMQKLRVLMSQSVNKTMWTGVIALTFIIVFAWALTVIISESISKPLRVLCNTTNQVAKGDFNARVENTSSNEIQELTNSMNSMIHKIGHLIEDIKLEQLKLRTTELKLLQAQINPHFLYNTLDTIIWLAEAGDKDQVVQMVSSLSDFFRTTLSKGRDWVTLLEEESHIRSYLQIQKFRYQDILEYEIEIPKELGDYSIPKLTLQPIIENALYHGIKNKRGKGKITVTGEFNKENIILIVTDNGIGLSQEELHKLRISLKKRPTNDSEVGFGLANVNERIQLNYGMKYGVEIDSVYGEGTMIKVKLPATYKTE